MVIARRRETEEVYPARIGIEIRPIGGGFSEAINAQYQTLTSVSPR